MIQILMALLTVAFAIANLVALIAGYLDFGTILLLTLACVAIWLAFKFIARKLTKARTAA